MVVLCTGEEFVYLIEVEERHPRRIELSRTFFEFVSTSMGIEQSFSARCVLNDPRTARVSLLADDQKPAIFSSFNDIRLVVFLINQKDYEPNLEWTSRLPEQEARIRVYGRTDTADYSIGYVFLVQGGRSLGHFS